MDISMADLSATQIYYLMTQSVIPRPVAWVLSEQANSLLNLAPFSYFNAVCSNPALIMLSMGFKENKDLKDTRANILARKHFVIHIPSCGDAESVNISARNLPADESEVDLLNLETVPMPGFSLPRLKETSLAMGCELYQCIELGPASQALILGEIKTVYIADTVIAGEHKEVPIIDPHKLDPLARLGGPNYCHIGKMFSIKRG